jgi:hypothetical protein
MIARKRCLLVIGMLCSLGLIACSGGEGGEDRVKVYPVTGKITLAGSPLPGAIVTFSPVDPKVGKVALGRTNDAGEYTLKTYEPGDGAAEGEYEVLVREAGASSGGEDPEAAHEQYSQGGGPSSHAGGRAGGSTDSLLPERYSIPGKTDLDATVTAGGENKFDFDLKP